MRLAELVAALSLGVDLGFGQPMEHVLRQCLIALRLAERLGLDDDTRMAVYYTALLVNVGCHSDAHEQAKWFGDDIALKSGKYAYEQRSLAGAAATLRLIGSGNPPLHRFRVGLEFTLGGFREMNGMIASHSALARELAVRLGLPDAVARHQDRLNWLNRLVVCCECNRPTLDSIRAAGFVFDHVERQVFPASPSFIGPAVLGSARLPAATPASSGSARDRPDKSRR